MQRGETVTLSDGRVISSTDVMGAKRGGRKFSYVTDSLYLPSIAKEVAHSDLLLCEGMFTSDMEETAYEKKHMTAGQAAQIAKMRKWPSLAFFITVHDMGTENYASCLRCQINFP